MVTLGLNGTFCQELVPCTSSLVVMHPISVNIFLVVVHSQRSVKF